MAVTAFLDRQHTGKSATSTDMGATHDELHEAIVTDRYLWPAELDLRGRGVNVVRVGDGLYPARHDRMNAYARAAPGVRCAAISAHTNAGQGDYGAVLFDSRSAGGRALAHAIAEALREHCPELARVEAIAARPGDWTADALATIAGIWSGPSNLSGVCFEPGFLNHPDHASLWTDEGVQRVGLALAEGITGWALTAG